MKLEAWKMKGWGMKEKEVRFKKVRVILISRGGNQNNVKYWAATFINEPASTFAMSKDSLIVAAKAGAFINKNSKGAHASMVNIEPKHAKC